MDLTAPSSSLAKNATGEDAVIPPTADVPASESLWQNICPELLLLIFKHVPDYLWVYAQVCVAWRDAAWLARGHANHFTSNYLRYDRYEGTMHMLAYDLYPILSTTDNFDEQRYWEAARKRSADELSLIGLENAFAQQEKEVMCDRLRMTVHSHWENFVILAARCAYKVMFTVSCGDRLCTGRKRTPISILFQNYYFKDRPDLSAWGSARAEAACIIIYGYMCATDKLAYFKIVVSALVRLKRKILLKELCTEHSAFIRNQRTRWPFQLGCDSMFEEAYVLGCATDIWGLKFLRDYLNISCWGPRLNNVKLYLNSITTRGYFDNPVVAAEMNAALHDIVIETLQPAEALPEHDLLCKLVKNLGHSTSPVCIEVIRRARHPRRMLTLARFYELRYITQCTTLSLLTKLVSDLTFMGGSVKQIDVVAEVMLNEAQKIREESIVWLPFCKKIETWTPKGRLSEIRFRKWLKLLLQYARREMQKAQVEGAQSSAVVSV